MRFTAADFRLICAWCHKVIRAPQRALYDEVPESHGVCPTCAVKMGMPEELLHHL